MNTVIPEYQVAAVKVIFQPLRTE